MKKILLSIASVVFAMNANAQVESAFINPETVYEGIEETQWVDDKGKDQSGYPIEAGHFLCESENVKMSIAYEEKGKISALAGESDNAKTVTIGGQVYEATKGVTGNSNPTATTTEASTNGFVIQFDVKKDGFIYAICKLSSNKPYYVWEGKAGQGERLVAYSLTMHMLDETTPLGEELNYTLPADADGYFDAQAADADKYADGTVLRWPEKIILGAEAEDVKKNGLGIVKFPVYADAGTYLFHATGSKVTIDGFVFSPTELDMKVNKVGEEPSEFDVWTVAGVTSLVGAEWDPTAVANDMKTTDGVTYTLVKEGVVLEKGIGYEFKVAKDHAWTESYGDDSGNAKLTVEETGTYTVTFTFNAETKEITTAAEKTGEAEIGEKTYSIIGTINGNWDTDTDMEKGADGVYTAVFENIAAGEYKFKVRVNHDWSESYGNGDDGDGNTVINVENDGSTVTVTFNPDNQELKCEIAGGAIEPQPAGGVIWEGDGSAGAVSWNGTYRFALEGHDGASECIAEIPQATWDKMMTETFYVDLEAATPQVRITNGWWDVEWVGGDIQPGNELLTDNGDGTFTLKVELANQPDLVATLLDKHLLFTGANYTPIKIYFAGGETAINSVKKAANADDAIYNVAGQKVNASYKGLVIKNGKKYIQK